MTLFEDGAPGQIHLVHHEIGLVEIQDIELAPDFRPLGQKAAQQPVGFRAQAQVEAGRLNLPVLDRALRAYHPIGDESLQSLVRQDAAPSRGLRVELAGTALHRSSIPPLPPFRQAVRAEWAPTIGNSRPLLLVDRKSTRLNSSHQIISYAVF